MITLQPLAGRLHLFPEAPWAHLRPWRSVLAEGSLSPSSGSPGLRRSSRTARRGLGGLSLRAQSHQRGAWFLGMAGCLSDPPAPPAGPAGNCAAPEVPGALRRWRPAKPFGCSLSLDSGRDRRVFPEDRDNLAVVLFCIRDCVNTPLRNHGRVNAVILCKVTWCVYN